MATQKDSEIDKLETVDEPNLIKNQTDFSRSALYGSDALEELGKVESGISFKSNEDGQNEEELDRIKSNSDLVDETGPQINVVKFNKIRQTLGVVYCKESGPSEWVKYYGKIQNSCLLLCETLVSQSFKICFCLYKSDLEEYSDKIRLPERNEKETRRILILSHRYEYETVRIIFEEESCFESIVDFVKKNTDTISKQSMLPINETNRYPFGKLFIELRRIKGLISNRDIKVEIEFNPYRLQSKIFEGGRNTPVKFDQRFYVPIHNKFNILTFKVVRFSKEGILSANKRAEVIKTFSYGIPFLQDEN